MCNFLTKQLKFLQKLGVLFSYFIYLGHPIRDAHGGVECDGKTIGGLVNG